MRSEQRSIGQTDLPAGVVRFWRELVAASLRRHRTPFYLCAAEPIAAGLDELAKAFAGLPVRHWFSCKTQPLPELLTWWNRRGLGIEVVSELELELARRAGFADDRILINGPAKHHWLPRHARRAWRVHFDSVSEARALAPLARKLDWACGVRLHTSQEFDPESPDWPTQFGLTPAEAVRVIKELQRQRVRLESVHFHLRTNVADARIVEQALRDTAAICRQAGFSPRYVDCGGGFPPPHVLTRQDQRVDHGFSLGRMAQVYRRARAWFPDLEEFWLENGRWLCARSGVLVVRILDVKERRGKRNVICDGGRTMNALVSLWEKHRLFTIPARRGPSIVTTVNGPTCMAFDQLHRGPLPRSMRAGDHLVWMEAGAYHLPWETRFSHPLATVLWQEGGRIRVSRAAADWQ